MTDTATLISEITDLQKEIDSRKDVLTEQSQIAFGKVFEEIFEEYGDILKGVAWTQYTPFFNDGDECIFGVHEICLEAVEDDSDIDDDDRWYYYESSEQFTPWASVYPDRGSEPKSRIAKKITVYKVKDPSAQWKTHIVEKEIQNVNFDQRYLDCYEKVRGIFSAVNSETMHDIYGDHAGIRITKDGTDVTEWEHE